MKPNTTHLFLTLLLAGLAAPAAAVDGMSLELGHGDKAKMGRIGLQWDWQKRWQLSQSLVVSGYWDTSLGYWRGDTNEPGARNIYDLGITPVLRLSRGTPTGWYAEAGIGAHLISETQINDRRRFSTAFQFGDHIGAGLRFGQRGEYDLSYRFQHLSNADIKKPNDGINFNQIRFAYHF